MSTWREYCELTEGAAGIALTERDFEIAKTLWYCRWLSREQLTELFFPSDQQARRRLLKLWRAGVFYRTRRRLAYSEGTESYYYTLTDLGLWLVADALHVPRESLGSNLASQNFVHLHHVIQTNQFYCSLIRAGADVAVWKAEDLNRREYQGGYFQPDAFMITNQIAAFIEWDNEMSMPNMREKLLRYQEYYKLGKLEEELTTKPLILICTSSPTRADRIKRLAEKVVRLPVFITTQDDAIQRPMDRIWLCSSKPDYQSLFQGGSNHV